MILVLMGTLFLCLLMTVPIAVSLCIASLAFFAVFTPDSPMATLLPQAMISAMDSFSLMAIPFFILMGTLMEGCGLARRIVKGAEKLTGAMPGGLGMAAVAASAFFAALCGSGPATVAAIGGIMMPAMKKQGYHTAYCAALVSAAAVIGPVIPPSIPMIVYGVTIGASVGELFLSGVVPGLIIAAVLMALNYFISRKRGYLGLDKKALAEKYGEDPNAKRRFRIDDSFWAIIMPIIVLGGIYGGIFTPTEAAAVGVMYSVVVGKFIYRELTLRKLRDALLSATELTAVSVILFGGANTFGRILTIGKIPQTIASFIMAATENPIAIMLLINLFLLVTGMFIDTISNVLLFAPLFWPLVKMLGYDAVYFGVIMTINLCIGMLTPPVGVNLFVGQTLSGAPLGAIIRDAIPFLIALILTLALFILFPQIVTFFPDLLYGR